MKRFNSDIILNFTPPVVGFLTLILLALSCGKGPTSGSESQVAVTPTPTPIPTERSESSPVGFWLAGNTSGGPIAVRFDSAGRKSFEVDLLKSGIDFGPITSLHFMDSSTLLFFVNPGTDKETIGTLDVKTGLVKNKAWGAESSIKAVFKNTPSISFFTGFQSGVLHAVTETSIISIRYNSDGGMNAEKFYDGTTSAECPSDKLTGAVLVRGGGGSQVLVMSTGTQPRINILGLTAGVINCKSSFDYSSGLTTSGHRPVSLVQALDGKVFVLYQHDVASGSDPKIVRYDYDGETLSNGVEIFKGQSNLGKKPFGMIARTNKRLLVGRPDVYALIEIELKGNTGEQTSYYERTSYAKELSALVVEPSY